MAKTYHTIYAVPSVKNQGFEMTVQPLQDGVVFKKDLPIEFEVNLTKGNKPFSEGAKTCRKNKSYRRRWNSPTAGRAA